MKRFKWLIIGSFILTIGCIYYYYFWVYLRKLDRTERILGERTFRVGPDREGDDPKEYAVTIFQGNEQLESVQSVSFTLEKRLVRRQSLGGTSVFDRENDFDYNVVLDGDTMIYIIFDDSDTLKAINVKDF